MYKKAIIFYLSLSGFSLIFSGCCPDPSTVTTEYSAYFGDISDVHTTTMIDHANNNLLFFFIYYNLYFTAWVTKFQGIADKVTDNGFYHVNICTNFQLIR